MSGQPRGHYEDGYGHQPQGTDSYYHDDQGHGYYDQHQTYQDQHGSQHQDHQQGQHANGGGYYDEGFVCSQFSQVYSANKAIADITMPAMTTLTSMKAGITMPINRATKTSIITTNTMIRETLLQASVLNIPKAVMAPNRAAEVTTLRKIPRPLAISL